MLLTFGVIVLFLAETSKPEPPKDLGMTIKLADLTNQLMGDEADFRKTGR